MFIAIGSDRAVLAEDVLSKVVVVSTAIFVSFHLLRFHRLYVHHGRFIRSSAPHVRA
jgi:hypothetical protein